MTKQSKTRRSDKFKEQSGFDTLNDDKLCEMLDSADSFVNALPADDPYCLSFLGNPGTGKTMLAKAIHSHAVEFNKYWINDSLRGVTQSREIYFKTTDTLTEYIFDKYNDQFKFCIDAWLLVIDDFGTQYDKSGFVLSKLFELINQRVGKWTVITSNLTLGQIAKEVDPRIASRLVREGGRVVDCSTRDFYLR